MRPRRGLVSGHVFRLARESTGRTQEQLAEALGVDRATVQGWETGRRPYTAMPLGQAIAVRHQMTQLGADAGLLDLLTDAAEVDYLVAVLVDAGNGVGPASNPLGHLVLTHRMCELIAWTVNGQTPFVLAAGSATGRRGPVAAAPTLAAGERAAFFAGLRAVTERAARDPHGLLQSRQAHYLAGLDENNRAWLDHRTNSVHFVAEAPWSPDWALARSVASALARFGDPEPIRAFVRNNTHSTAELAALNYSAYWVGEYAIPQNSDDFMTGRSVTWRGARLLRHIADRLTVEHGCLDLNIHTLWVLLAARRGLTHDVPGIGVQLQERASMLLDHRDALSEQSRKELASVLYGLRMDGVSA